MYSQIRTVLTVAAVVLSAGCATAGKAPASQHNVVTADELARAGDVTLFEALTQIRPAFLRSRGAIPGATSPASPVQVYIDGMRMGGLEHIRQIAAKNVTEVRFLEPQQAIARFGGDNTGGALVIVLK